ncbi:MAG: cysteine hydrolase family protein [Planctomycetota bacterium]|jgi:nicotinamidase-related amidase
MSIEALFWDIDTQHDFMDADGKLPVPGAQAIVGNLQRLTQFAVGHGIPILATADAHPPGDPEFEQFGEHCVPGTRGQRKIEGTSPPGGQVADPQKLDEQLQQLRLGKIPQLIVEKQALNVFTVPMADTVLKELSPGRVVVYGVATECCVRAQVLSLAERGWRVALVTDAIQALDPADGRNALSEMQKAGAELVESEPVLRELAREANA